MDTSQKKLLPHCNTHEKYIYFCHDCCKLYRKDRHEWTKSSPYYCEICKIYISKYGKNRHEKSDKHLYFISNISI